MERSKTISAVKMTLFLKKIQKNPQKTIKSNTNLEKLHNAETNVQKLVVFKYTGNEQSKKEIKRMIPFTIKKNKIFKYC